MVKNRNTMMKKSNTGAIPDCFRFFKGKESLKNGKFEATGNWLEV